MIRLVQPVKGELNYDGVVSQKYGICVEPTCSKYKSMGLNGHSGIDFRGGRGTPIFAAHSGSVIYAQEWQSISGKTVKILDESREFATIYAHLDEYLVSTGENVTQGQIIGYMGNSGSDYYYMAVHLHFGLYETVDGITINQDNGYKGAIDPMPYFIDEDIMKYVIIGKEQYLLNESLKLAFNIGDEEELAKLKQQGLAGKPQEISALPDGYLVYPLVDRDRLKDIFGL